MITMIDEIFDRQYRAARSELNNAISQGFGGLARAVLNAFEVLHRIEYSAPWANQRKRARPC